jgi:hypothetical protein
VLRFAQSHVNVIYVAEELLQGMLAIIQCDAAFKAVLGCFPENVLVKEMLPAIHYCLSFTV